MGRNRVECELVETDVTQDGRTMRGVRGECSECEHQESCFGTSDRSRTRVLMLIRENCPEDRGDENFYADQDEGKPLRKETPARAGRPSGYTPTFRDDSPAPARRAPSGRLISSLRKPVQLAQQDLPLKLPDRKPADPAPQTASQPVPIVAKFWMGEASAGEGEPAIYGGGIYTTEAGPNGIGPVEVLQVGGEKEAGWACALLNSHAEMMDRLRPFVEDFIGCEATASEPIRSAIKTLKEAEDLACGHPGKGQIPGR